MMKSQDSLTSVGASSHLESLMLTRHESGEKRNWFFRLCPLMTA